MARADPLPYLDAFAVPVVSWKLPPMLGLYAESHSTGSILERHAAHKATESLLVLLADPKENGNEAASRVRAPA
jgi:hypothetical protein